jgi:hypothetical protein
MGTKPSRYNLGNAFNYLRLAYQSMSVDQAAAQVVIKEIITGDSREKRLLLLAEAVLETVRQLRPDDADEQPVLPHVHPEREP